MIFTLLLAIAAAAPVFSWSVPLPGGVVSAASHAETSAPVAWRGDLLLGSAGGDALYRVSASSGALVQAFPASASVAASPTLSDGLVLFGDLGGALWCYTAEGTLAWTVQTQAPILAAPTVASGRVFVSNVADEVVALNLEDGALLWRYQRRSVERRASVLALFAAPQPLVSGAEVIVGFSDGVLLGLAQETGEVAWEMPVGEGRYPDLVAAAVEADGAIFAAGYLAPLVAVDRITREPRWRLEVGAAHPPLARAGELFHPGTDGHLRAVVALTGAVRWDWDSETQGALTTPVWTEGGLLVGSTEGVVYLIDPKNGQEIWRFREPLLLDGVSATPLVTGREIFFPTDAGNLVRMVIPKVQVTSSRGRGGAVWGGRP